MNRPNKDKLNHLLTEWPVGAVLTSAWLKENGYYKQLVKSYCDNEWIKSIGRGAYVRLNDRITWPGSVTALQSQLNLMLHVGGLTALQLYGIWQYVVLNDADPLFYLYNTVDKQVHLPTWFKTYFIHCHLEQKKIFDTTICVSKYEVDGVQLGVSEPERAILEVLALVPNKFSLAYANELMENLDRLRAKEMQRLLECCHLISVKRLFLYLAERNNLSCFNALDLNRINLGAGKRVIGEGGLYNAKWMLSLPELEEIDNQIESPDE